MESKIEVKEERVLEPIDVIEEEIQGLPTKIKEEGVKIYTLMKIQDALKKSKEESYDLVYSRVTKELDDDGKRKYPNEKAREVETNKEISFLPDFKYLCEQEKENIKLIQERKAEIEYLKNRFKATEMLLDIMKIRGGKYGR